MKSPISFKAVVMERPAEGWKFATPGSKTGIAPLWTGWECQDDPLTLQGALAPSAELSQCFLFNNQHWNFSGQKGQDKSAGDYGEVCIGQAREQR